MEDAVREARAAIGAADAVLVAAGAGMGVDSGLPDFRGNEGFWRAYPAFERLGLSFVDLANPRWFRTDPELAWGFYGHRLALYRATAPHAGFALLRALCEAKRASFVFTSNVDGAFTRAGFDPEATFECHGALDFLQCTRGCGVGVFPADDYQPDVDPETFRARTPLPTCPQCRALARPNVLMFGDFDFDPERSDEQEAHFALFLERIRQQKWSLVVVECGAGTAVPTVRHTSEQLVRGQGATLVRINLREPSVPRGQIGLALGARAALERILG